MMNEKIAAVRRSTDGHPGLGLPDLVAQKYSDSGNQRPAPQVPVASNNSCRDVSVLESDADFCFTDDQSIVKI